MIKKMVGFMLVFSVICSGITVFANGPSASEADLRAGISYADNDEPGGYTSNSGFTGYYTSDGYYRGDMRLANTNAYC